MRITDGSGTYEFIPEKVNGFDNYGEQGRYNFFKDVGEVDSRSEIGRNYRLVIDFLNLTEDERDELNEIYLNNSITLITTQDEATSGEFYYNLTGTPELPIYILDKQFNHRKALNWRDALMYQVRMTFRFQTVTKVFVP